MFKELEQKAVELVDEYASLANVEHVVLVAYLKDENNEGFTSAYNGLINSEIMQSFLLDYTSASLKEKGVNKIKEENRNEGQDNGNSETK